MKTKIELTVIENALASVTKTARLITIVAYITVAIALSSAALNVATFYEARNVYAPLGDYPQQRVVSNITRISPASQETVPAVNFSDGGIHVIAVKVNNTDEPVDVAGTVTWVGYIDGISILSSISGVGVRQPGEQTTPFNNIFPEEVITYIELQHEKGNDLVPLRLEGIETPRDKNGEEGIPETWNTEEFVVIYDE